MRAAITIAWVDSEEFNFQKQLLSHIMQRLGNPSTLTIVRRSTATPANTRRLMPV
jgi:hypothetical protein